jgi:hypothetical protein
MPSSPPLSNATLADGFLKLRGAVRQAVDLAGQIERGQAQMPLRDHFEDLVAGLEGSPFTLTLIGLDAESRGAALGWLCGEDFRVLTLDVPGTAGLVEVRLAERGYVLLKSGKRQEFDRLAPFLEAVRAADLVRQGDADAWLDPMHLELTAPRGLQGLRILMPESPAAISRNPAMMIGLRGKANLLSVAGPTGRSPDPASVEVIRELSSDAPAHWVIACGQPPAADFYRQGWPSRLGGRSLPPVHLDPDAAPPAIPPFLTDPGSAIRRGFFGSQQLGRFEAALDMVEERIQADLRLQNARRKALTRRAASFGDRGRELALRDSVDSARRLAGEGLSRLRNELAEAHRERLVPTSAAGNRMKNLLEDLNEDDLARETSKTATRLTIAPSSLRGAEALVREIVRDDIRADSERIAVALQALESELAADLDGPIMLDRIDARSVAESIAKTIYLDVRYQGRIEQRGGLEGIFEIVMHARKPLLLLTMVSSLGIPLFIKLKQLIAPAMALFFFGGLWLARKSHRDSQRERLETELDRLRDAFATEVRRLYEQSLRDTQATFHRHLQDVEKKADQDLQERLRARAAEQGERSTRERSEVNDKLKVVDNRQRELGSFAQQAGRLRSSASEARSSLDRAVLDALDELARSPGVA